MKRTMSQNITMKKKTLTTSKMITMTELTVMKIEAQTMNGKIRDLVIETLRMKFMRSRRRRNSRELRNLRNFKKLMRKMVSYSD